MKRRLFLASVSTIVTLLPPYFGAFAGNRTQLNQAVAQVESYLNSIETLSASFLQVDPDGNIANGHLYLQRPGRLRFEYDKPSPLLIVADGIWLIFYDKKLGQVNRYPLYQTPLGVLVDKPANLQKMVKVVNAELSLGVLRIKVIDKLNPDEGWIEFTFSQQPLMLRQWKVRDMRGGTTVLTLNNIQMNQILKPDLFFFDDPDPFME